MIFPCSKITENQSGNGAPNGAAARTPTKYFRAEIKFLPENLQNTKLMFGKNKMVEGAAKSYFEVEIWPCKKQEIVKNIESKIFANGPALNTASCSLVFFFFNSLI